MAGGSSQRIQDLPPSARRIVHEARRAFLTTIGSEGYPHTVPVCFAVQGDEIVIAVDHKPKSGRRLARLRNIEANPSVALVVDRWDEDWSRLGWVMMQGEATVLPPGAPEELLARYPQYVGNPPEGELIVVSPRRVLWWSWA